MSNNVFFKNSIEFSMPLKKCSTLYKQKSVSLLDYQLAENLILVFSFYEREEKKRKSSFIIKFAGIIITIIFT